MNLDWLVKAPIAHRGLHKGFIIPENSLEAFKRAVNKNYAIELDVRITKDKKLIVFHDKNLIRMCASRKKVRNQTYDTIKNIKLYKTQYTIPLLDEVLEIIAGKVPIVFEIKNYGQVGEFEAILSSRLEQYEGEFAISSFNPDVVNWFKRYKPEFTRGIIFGDIKKFQIKFYKLTFLYRLWLLRPHFVSLDYKLIDTLLPSFCKKLKIPIVSWTVDSKKKARKAKVLVDNIIFENIKP